MYISRDVFLYDILSKTMTATLTADLRVHGDGKHHRSTLVLAPPQERAPPKERQGPLPCQFETVSRRQVDSRLSEKGNSNSHGARLVYYTHLDD